jgi:hypothetical protein
MSSTMYLRGIREEVAREAKALAAREGITLTSLVERALERETRGARPAPARLSEIARDIEWYEQNKAALLDRLEGEYLAIVDQAVVDHDPDLEALAARVAERYGARSVYLPLCRRSRRVADARSPRLVR